jgi:hypothetical protein
MSDSMNDTRPSDRSCLLAVAFLLLVALYALAGCTVVKKDGMFYGNVGFEKQISKVSIEKNPDGTERTVVEGVKNTTPQIVEAAVGAAVKAAK